MKAGIPENKQEMSKKKFWKELITYFPLIRHEPHTKRCTKQFFYCCICIRCRGNVFSEPLPSNDRGIHIQTYGRDLWSTPLSWNQVSWYI
jgi:hypothetical protein